MSDDMTRRNVRTRMDLAVWIAEQTGQPVDAVVERMKARCRESGVEWRADQKIDPRATAPGHELRSADGDLERVRAKVSAALDAGPRRGAAVGPSRAAQPSPVPVPKLAGKSPAQLRAERHMRRIIR